MRGLSPNGSFKSSASSSEHEFGIFQPPGQLAMREVAEEIGGKEKYA